MKKGETTSAIKVGGKTYNVLLSNKPEDVAKWREERRKRWPSAANVLRKEQEAAKREMAGAVDDSGPSQKRKRDGGAVGAEGRNAKRAGTGGRGQDHRGKGRGRDRAAAASGSRPVPLWRQPLLQRLLRRELRHEHSIVLQCLRHFVKCEFDLDHARAN